MSESRAAYRYAKALMELAVEQKKAEALDGDMRMIRETLAGSDSLREVVASPVLKAGEKVEALTGIFGKTEPLTRQMFALLGENKRIGILDEVARQYILLYESMQGQDVARVTTAVPLSEGQEKQILDRLKQITGKAVTLENTIDPELIGGFILRVGDLEYNASLAGKLANLKRELIQK